MKVNRSGETMVMALALDCNRQLIVHLFECTLVVRAGLCAFAWPPKSSVPRQKNRRERATSLTHRMISKLKLKGPIMKHRKKAVQQRAATTYKSKPVRGDNGYGSVAGL